MTPYKVMIVEDEKPAREVYKQMIAEESGLFELVGEAPNGEKGLQLCKAYKPHFLVTDLTMPVMGGIEMMMELAKLEREMPLMVILSCHRDFHYAQKAIELGASSYLLKEDCLAHDSLLADTLKQLIAKLNGRSYDAVNMDEHSSISEYPPGHQNSAMETVIRQLQADLSKSYRMEQVASQVGYSMPYFSTMFKKTTGRTFTQYIMELRINKAKQMISTTNLRTNEIAERVGLENYRHFNKIFKRIVGMNPSDYRQSSKHNES
ncbi:response regulator transcription factor [Paenibacillus germinis]|nr:helix-turn-helix domain-containing protein [Paenibacillus germinis]